MFNKIIFNLAAGTLVLLFPLSVHVGGAPPKLIFKKQISGKKDTEGFRYKIHKGEYVYSILRSMDVPEQKLPTTVEEVKELNPHLEDIDKIYPDQVLKLPLWLKKGEAKPSEKAAAKKGLKPKPKVKIGPIESLKYTIKPGDTVANLLRRIGGLTDKQIFTKYVDLFRRLNPQIKNINKLEVGQKVVLPVPMDRKARWGEELQGADNATRIAEKKQKGAKQKPKASLPKEAKEEKDETDLLEKTYSQQAINKAMAVSLLKRIGFRFAPGREMLYPFGGHGWIHINLTQMPLANAPWGEPVLFVPDLLFNRINPKEINRAGLTICRFDSSWSLGNLLNNLEDISGQRLYYWGANKKLILSDERRVLELGSGYKLILKQHNQKKVFFFSLKSGIEKNMNKLLLGYLVEEKVYVFHLQKNTQGLPKFFTLDYPAPEKLIVPKIVSSNFWEEISTQLDINSTVLNPGSGHFNDVFPALQEKDLAGQETLRLNWGGKKVPSIALSLPVFKIKNSSVPLVLLTPEQSSPYLINLLNLKGYNCFALEP